MLHLQKGFFEPVYCSEIVMLVTWPGGHYYPDRWSADSLNMLPWTLHAHPLLYMGARRVASVSKLANQVHEIIQVQLSVQVIQVRGRDTD